MHQKIPRRGLKDKSYRLWPVGSHILWSCITSTSRLCLPSCIASWSSALHQLKMTHSLPIQAQVMSGYGSICFRLDRWRRNRGRAQLVFWSRIGRNMQLRSILSGFGEDSWRTNKRKVFSIGSDHWWFWSASAKTKVGTTYDKVKDSASPIFSKIFPFSMRTS